MTAKARWTLLVYMAGDNDIDRYGVADLEEMLSVGTTTHEVRVVVQFDRKKPTTPGRYLIPEEPGVPMRNCRIKAFKKMNAANPKVLARFIAWGRKHYPADRLALVLWDHGNGWLPLKPDPREVRAARIALQAHRRALKGERTSRSHHPKAPDGSIAHTCYFGVHGGQALDMPRLKQALSHGLGPDGHVDLLAFDACHMAQLEVAYQLHNFADVLVGSEEENPFQGWPYDIVLKAIAQNPGMSAEPFGIKVAKAFLEYVRYPITKKNGVTQSVLRMARIDAVAAATDRFGKSLTSALKDQAMEVHSIVAGVQRYLTHSFADLGDLALLAHTHIKKPDVQKAAVAVIEAIGRARAFAGAHGPSVKRSTGISVYIPPNRQWFEEYRNSYSRLDLSIDHPGWFQFLNAYHAGSGQLARESGGLAKVLSRVDVLIPIPIEDI